jgi:hypothetical protein
MFRKTIRLGYLESRWDIRLENCEWNGSFKGHWIQQNIPHFSRVSKKEHIYKYIYTYNMHYTLYM